jgi:2-methylcitrate dehydratase PrpD
MPVDPVRNFAEHVVGTDFSALPPSTVSATKRDVLDTFGCLLGGSGAPGIAELLRLAGRWGGREEAGILFSALRVPAPQAALLHASMAHALDFDDTLDHGGSIHPGAAVLGAVLATAELTQASGQDFVLAAALGLDVSSRVALAATVDRGWHRTAAMGIFGATAAAGKLLGLTVEQMAQAFGIAYSHAAGNRQCILDGALTKRLQAGQAASAGVFSAILSQEGFTGASNVFAGRYGFYEMYQPGGYDLPRLTDGLGSVFRGDEVSFKPYPCGRPQHATLDAAIALHDQLDLASTGRDAGIAEVVLETDPSTYADAFESGTHKRQPTQIVEAQFALPFLIAAALVHGKVGIDEVAGIEDGSVLALAARISGAPSDGRPKGWARLSVRLADGRTGSLETTIPLGSPQRPLSVAQQETKFRDCAANAVQPIAPEAVTGAIQALSRLEDLPAATDLLRFFPWPAPALER